MRYIKVVFVFLFLPCIGYSQKYLDYYNLVNEAEFWLYKNEFKKAEFLYSKAFKIEEPFGKDLYLSAKCFAFQGKTSLCIKFLKKSATKTACYPSIFILRDSLIFINVFKSKNKLTEMCKTLDYIEMKRNKKIQNGTYFMLQDSVSGLLKRDRYNRNFLKSSISNMSDLNSTNEIRLSDSILQKQFIDLILKYGYPGYSSIGTDMASEILLHFSDFYYYKYKNLIFDQLKKGKVLPYEYAKMTDRIDYAPYNDQCFLYLYTRDICKLEDYSEIIKNRMKIGLSIYFEGIRKTPFEKPMLLPWVNAETVTRFSLLNKK